MRIAAFKRDALAGLKAVQGDDAGHTVTAASYRIGFGLRPGFANAGCSCVRREHTHLSAIGAWLVCR
jgi:hypothetical protein